MSKKIFAVVLALVMVIGALSVAASARITFGASGTEAAPTPAPNPNAVLPMKDGSFPLWIAGIQVTTKNMKDIFGEKPDAPKATAENGPGTFEDQNTMMNKGKVSFDPETCTLTLDGATLFPSTKEGAGFFGTIDSEFTWGNPKTSPELAKMNYNNVTLTIKVVNNSFVSGTNWAISGLNDIVFDIAPGKSLSTEGAIGFDGYTTADMSAIAKQISEESGEFFEAYREYMNSVGGGYVKRETPDECLFAAYVYMQDCMDGDGWLHLGADMTVKGGALYVVSQCYNGIQTNDLKAIDTTIYVVDESRTMMDPGMPYSEGFAVMVYGDVSIDNSIIYAVNDCPKWWSTPNPIDNSAMHIYGDINAPADGDFTTLASPYPYEYSEREYVTTPATLHCNEYGLIKCFEPSVSDYAVAYTVSIESNSYCSSFRKVNAPENHSFMTIKLADGTVGNVQFIEVRENEWLINLVSDLAYPRPGDRPYDMEKYGPFTDCYAGIENAKFKISEEMYLWNWSPIFSCFYTTVKETEWVEVPVVVKEPDAKWYEVWKYEIKYKAYPVEVFKTYYLQTGKDGAKLTESPLFAASTLYQDRRNPTHTPAGKATGLGNGTHAVTCAACKKVTVERCKFNALTHRCTQCGSYDPKYIDYYTPLLTAELNDPINPTAVVFTVNVKMVNPTVKPAKVDYAVGEYGKWNEVKGNQFTIQGAADQFGTNKLYIRVTDLNGMETIYKVDPVLTNGSPLIPLDDDRHPQPPMPRP